MGEYQKARKEIVDHGVTVETLTERGHEVTKPNPACEIAPNAWNRCKSLLHELAIGPRNSMNKDEEDKDPFEMLRKKRQMS